MKDTTKNAIGFAVALALSYAAGIGTPTLKRYITGAGDKATVTPTETNGHQETETRTFEISAYFQQSGTPDKLYSVQTVKDTEDLHLDSIPAKLKPPFDGYEFVKLASVKELD